MDTEVCSIYLADNNRRCYYLMATRGLQKPRGRSISLAFNEGVVGLVGSRAKPINLADVQNHPSFKYVPQVNEERFRSFLGVPIIHRRQPLGVLVVQQRELRQFDESEESFMVTPWPHRWLGSYHTRSSTPFWSISADAHLRAGSIAWYGGGGRVARQRPTFARTGIPCFDVGHRQRA